MKLEYFSEQALVSCFQHMLARAGHELLHVFLGGGCQIFSHDGSRSNTMQRVPSGHSPRRGETVASLLRHISSAWTTIRNGFQYLCIPQISSRAREGKRCIKTWFVLNSKMPAAHCSPAPPKYHQQLVPHHLRASF